MNATASRHSAHSVTALLRAALVPALAAGLLSACAAGPDREALAQRYRASVPIVPDANVLAKPNAYDPRRWPVRQVQTLVSGCWGIERDGRYNEIDSFRVKARLAPDGSVTESEVVNAEAMLLDPVFRELALSAQQALTGCGPLPLPPADYEGWRELTFRFMPFVATPVADPVVPNTGEIGAPTSGELDSLRGHIERCWGLPVGIRKADEMVVTLRVALRPGGAVQRVEVTDKERLKRDPNFEVAAKAAIRAVLRCSPLPLPPEKYDAWKTILLTFDPWEMLNAR